MKPLTLSIGSTGIGKLITFPRTKRRRDCRHRKECSFLDARKSDSAAGEKMTIGNRVWAQAKMIRSDDEAIGPVRSIRPVRTVAQTRPFSFDPDVDVATKVKGKPPIEVHVVATDVGKHVVDRSNIQGLKIRDLE